jgi:hypothetical protein
MSSSSRNNRASATARNAKPRAALNSPSGAVTGKRWSSLISSATRMTGSLMTVSFPPRILSRYHITITPDLTRVSYGFRRGSRMALIACCFTPGRRSGKGREPPSEPATNRMIRTANVGCPSFRLLAARCRESKNVQYGVQSHPPSGRQNRGKAGVRLCARGPSAHGLDPWASTPSSVRSKGVDARIKSAQDDYGLHPASSQLVISMSSRVKKFSLLSVLHTI